MKKIIQAFLLSGIILASLPAAAQVYEPGDPGSDPQPGGDPPLGGGAPVGGGTLILLALGTAYGGKKLYRLKQTGETTDNDEY